MGESVAFNKSHYTEEILEPDFTSLCIYTHTYRYTASKRTISDTLLSVVVRDKSMWMRPTWSVDLLSPCVGGEHLTRELVLLLPVVVLQVVHQHDISSLLHRHHLTEHLQLQHSNINMRATCTLGVSHDLVCTTVAKQNTLFLIIRIVNRL